MRRVNFGLIPNPYLRDLRKQTGESRTSEAIRRPNMNTLVYYLLHVFLVHD